jgi:hypothetical protein
VDRRAALDLDRDGDLANVLGGDGELVDRADLDAVQVNLCAGRAITGMNTMR